MAISEGAQLLTYDGRFRTFSNEHKMTQTIAGGQREFGNAEPGPQRPRRRRFGAADPRRSRKESASLESRTSGTFHYHRLRCNQMAFVELLNCLPANHFSS